MGQYNEDLHRRQETGRVGHAVLAPAGGAGGGSWKALRVPGAVLILGFVLVLVGPVPGLGMFLVMGGVAALALTAILVLLGNYS